MKCLAMILPALLFAAPVFAQSGVVRDPLDGPSIFSADRRSPRAEGGGVIPAQGSRAASLSFAGATRDDQNRFTAFLEIASGQIVQVREGQAIPGDGRIVTAISFQSVQISGGGGFSVLPLRDISGGAGPAVAPKAPARMPGAPPNGSPDFPRTTRGRGEFVPI